MALSTTEYTVEAGQVGQAEWDLSFEGGVDNPPGYLAKAHIFLWLNDVQVTVGGGASEFGGSGITFSWVTSTRVSIAGYSPVLNDKIEFRRTMPTDKPPVNFVDTAGITEKMLDNSNLANLYAVHEIRDGFGTGTQSYYALAKLYANGEEDYEVEPGQYSAKHWSIKANDLGAAQAALAAAQANLAAAYAETAEDVVVPGGSGYSAFHWREKTEEVGDAKILLCQAEVANCEAQVALATTEKLAAETAKLAAETAQAAAEAAQAAAALAQTGAETAETNVYNFPNVANVWGATQRYGMNTVNPCPANITLTPAANPSNKLYIDVNTTITLNDFEADDSMVICTQNINTGNNTITWATNESGGVKFMEKADTTGPASGWVKIFYFWSDGYRILGSVVWEGDVS